MISHHTLRDQNHIPMEKQGHRSEQKKRNYLLHDVRESSLSNYDFLKTIDHWEGFQFCSVRNNMM